LNFEKSESITTQLSGILTHRGYPLSALIESRFSAQWLRKGALSTKSNKQLDYIFELRNQDRFEIIISEGNSKTYGGWLATGTAVTLLDEIKNDYRVVEVTIQSGERIRHEYCDGYGYQPVNEKHRIDLVSTNQRGNL